MSNTSLMIVGRQPQEKTGTCELCGGHNRMLRILVLAEYIGWTCQQCIEQVGKSQVRRYVSTGEETEPCE